MAPEAFLKYEYVKYVFSNVKIPLNLDKKSKNVAKFLILALKINVRLVPLDFPQCNKKLKVSSPVAELTNQSPS